MFVSDKDAALVGVIVVLSGLLGVTAAGRLSRALTRDVATIRDGLVAVGGGEREVELQAGGGVIELRELADAANAMISRLAIEEAARDQAESARRHLIAAASHDLRTPITSLQLLAAAIDDELVEGQVRGEYVRRMLTHIEALSALIDDLFELSRLEAGDINWTLEQVARRPAGVRDRGRHASSGRRARDRREGGSPGPAGSGTRQPGEASAGALQPDPERDTPLSCGRHRGRPGRIAQ